MLDTNAHATTNINDANGPVLSGNFYGTVQLNNATAPTPEELAALESQYRALLLKQYEFLDFKGQIDTTEPLLLPLEEVYVQLRAVANVPERQP